MNKIGWCSECSVWEGNHCPTMNHNDNYDVGRCCYTCKDKDSCEDSCKSYIRYDKDLNFNGRNYWKCPKLNEVKEEVRKLVIQKDFSYEVMGIKSQIENIEKKYDNTSFRDTKSITDFISNIKEICLKHGGGKQNENNVRPT